MFCLKLQYNIPCYCKKSNQKQLERRIFMFDSFDSICRSKKRISRSISAENVYGKPGAGGMADIDAPQEDVLKIGQQWSPEERFPTHASAKLGKKHKVRPCIYLAPSSTTTLMDIDGPGCIRHIWLTFDTVFARELILRMYWDNEEEPSVAVPLGDFFCNAAKHESRILAIPINVNPNNGMNCYFPMPFGKHARITVENLNPEAEVIFFYTFNYTLEDLPEDVLYFHASFNRSNPLPFDEDFVITDNIEGKGQFVGCYMTWQQNNDGWWGEGEVKMFIDDDTEYPTICGTGTEDYFGGAWGFFDNFSAPFLGFPAGKENKTGTRHSLYRFHVLDPVYFDKKFKATIQALGWHNRNQYYMPLQDDISATAYWYQTEPHKPLKPLPDFYGLEIV